MRNSLKTFIASVPLILSAGCTQVMIAAGHEREKTIYETPAITPTRTDNPLLALYGLTRLLDETANPERYNPSNERDGTLAKTYRWPDESPIIGPTMIGDKINSSMTRVEDDRYRNY